MILPVCGVGGVLGGIILSGRPAKVPLARATTLLLNNVSPAVMFAAVALTGVSLISPLVML